jgi:hypothetical protein
MTAGFFSVQHFCRMTRVQSMRTAQVQGTAGAQNAEKLGGHILVPEQMLQDFETDYFIECSGFAGEIVKIPLLELQARRICPFVADQEVPCLLHLLWFKVNSHHTGPTSICEPGKIPIATTGVQHIPSAALPEMAERGPITSVQVEAWIEKISDFVTDGEH